MSHGRYARDPRGTRTVAVALRPGRRNAERTPVARGLLIIDIQNDYFPGGAMPLVGPENAAAMASAVLERFRRDGEPVVHVQHIWDEQNATFMRPGTAGVEIHPSVAPIAGEPVISKAYPNSF